VPTNNLGKIRRSQIVTIAGPGAIVDFRTDKGPVSVVSAGLDDWPPGTPIHEARLERKLNVSGFRAPPATPEEFASNQMVLPAARFPRWMQCPSCHSFKLDDDWARDVGEPALYCSPCSSRTAKKTYVIPAPFVVACERGHLDDFPWVLWVQHGPACKKKTDYRLEGTGGAGLGALRLTCEGCGASETMDGAFNDGTMKAFGPCTGARPWLVGVANEGCNENRKTLQRGASNIYFPVVTSALDIPPWSDGLQQRLKRDWDRIMKMDEPKLREFLRVLDVMRQEAMAEDELVRKILERRQRLDGAGNADLRVDEYAQLAVDQNLPNDERAEFEIRVEHVKAEIRPWIRRLVRVLRLREVRALRAFTRVRYPDPEQPGQQLPAWASLSNARQDWFPAVENRGEGIFVELDADRLGPWSTKFQARADEINDAYAKDWKDRHKDSAPPRQITPKVLLVHSLAHAVIRQLSLECGYSAASLRERLYVDDGCCGFLIYTAAPDSDGTLGGLARQGKPDRFAEVLRGALVAQKWCASDPLCVYGAHGFSERATGAACHACLLVAETSCEEFNRLLDRQTLVGPPDDPSLGFFYGSTLLE
jgi:hypothetical protein